MTSQPNASPTGTRLSLALSMTIEALPLGQADSALVRLAEGYAEAIDADPDRLSELGPKLLAALTALGATPQARAAVVKGGQGAGALAALRAKRATAG